MSVWHTACKLLTLTLIGALPGCVVYQFDPSSVEVTEVPPYETHTVPFRVAGDEQPDWLIPESDEVPEVYLARSQLKYGWPNVTTLNTITSIITIGLIPAHDEQPYYDVYELTWQGETLAQSQVHYTLDTYFSLYFPTPLLFLGSLADEQDEHTEAKAYITDLHKDQLLATIDQQRKEFQSLNPTTPEDIAAYLTGPGRSSVYRPAAITRLIDMAPEADALAYHEANSEVPGYVDLLPVEHQAWLIGPENLRGFDLQTRLAQGAEEDELLIDMLNAYPTRESGQLVATAVTWGYYTGMTPEHRSILKTGGLPESLVERMTNEAPLPELLTAAQSGQLRDADGNIRIPTQEELLEQLVRKDNQGRYMSPYTSDDVLAEWVNSAINANIGS
ncbi:MAG: carboxyl-terminal protease-like protein, partial [Pseudomonadota bacterium]|nr:carboxyl-terminal protease-like protein [Pseudomonadota bacterium]